MTTCTNPRLDEKLEQIREFSRNLWRNKVLRDCEHYAIVGLVDDVAEIAADGEEQSR